MFEVMEVGKYSRESHKRHQNIDVIKVKYEGNGHSFEAEMTVSEAKELSRKLRELAEEFESYKED